LWSFLCFNGLSWWVTALAFTAVAWSYCWNLQCISHNFIHNPYFTNPWLNRAFSVLESVALGVPHLLYHHYHLNHHWGDSDAKGPAGPPRGRALVSPPQRRRPARAVLALLPAELLARRGDRGAASGLAARLAARRSARRRDARAGRVLAVDAACGLALLRVLL